MKAQQIVDDAVRMRVLVKAARKMPIILRVAECVVCNHSVLVLDRVDQLEMLEANCVRECPRCKLNTVLLAYNFDHLAPGAEPDAESEGD